jgi:cystathionine beta-synthase
MATWAALQVARVLPAEKLVVVLLPDTGERYLSKVHSDEWMRDNHLLDPDVTRVAQALSSKSPGLPRLLSVEAHEPVRKALQLVQRHGVSQLPVLREGRVVGTLYDSEIMKRVLEDPAALDQPVESVMGSPLPVVGVDEPLSRVTRLLADRNAAVLVQEGSELLGILTRFDMLQFIAGDE